MVAEGRFRQDLFYRINVMNMHVPPLRDRAEDIAALAMLFLRRYSEAYGKVLDGFEVDAMLQLRRYPWPGNVRELENTIQHAVIMAEGTLIRTADFPTLIQDAETTVEVDELRAGSFEHLVREYKGKLVREAIQQCNGNKTLAAQSLCISRAYLHRLIRHSGDTIWEEVPDMSVSVPHPSSLAM
jgi:transcriptional regulator with PAS, ATPase and Fis domain